MTKPIAATPPTGTSSQPTLLHDDCPLALVSQMGSQNFLIGTASIIVKNLDFVIKVNEEMTRRMVDKIFEVWGYSAKDKAITVMREAPGLTIVPALVGNNAKASDVSWTGLRACYLLRKRCQRCWFSAICLNRAVI